MNNNARRAQTLLFTALLSAVTLFLMLGSGYAAPDHDDHAEQGVHEEEEGHRDHEEDDAASAVTLTAAQVALAGLETAPVSRGDIHLELPLTGEVRVNQDRLAHIAPRVSGIVREVRTKLGDVVGAGDVMAILDSRELADARAAYLAAQARLALALATFDREKGLWERKLTAEQEYLEATQGLAEARIELRSVEQQLHALGLTESEVTALAEEHGPALTTYELKAPFAGTIIERHITTGEQVDAEADLYTLGNLSTVWVIASVYEKDVAQVREGQAATFTVKPYPDRIFHGTVTWVADIMEEETRTLQIRLEVANEHRLLKPGMFARVALAAASKRNVLTVPPSALQRQRGESIAFVAEGDGVYERREVRLGIRSATAVEILDGLEAGEHVVTAGSFLLKSELEKAGFEAGHAH